MTHMSHAPTKQAADRIWLASYPPTVPADLPPLAHRSLGHLFEESCLRYAERVAFSSMGREMTFRDLEEASRQVAVWLQGMGLSKGDRVAVMMPNILQNPVTVYGILRAGLVVVNVNPLYTPRELEHQLNDSGTRAIFVLENFAHTVQQVVARTPVRHVIVTTMGDMLGLKGHIVNLVVRRIKKLVPAWSIPSALSFRQVLSAGARGTLTPVDMGLDDLAFLQYTGGTTGISKGAMLTHRNLLCNKDQMSYWLDSAFLRQKRPDVLNFL